MHFMECMEREGDGYGREGFRQEEDNGEVKGMVVRVEKEMSSRKGVSRKLKSARKSMM